MNQLMKCRQDNDHFTNKKISLLVKQPKNIQTVLIKIGKKLISSCNEIVSEICTSTK